MGVPYLLCYLESWSQQEFTLFTISGMLFLENNRFSQDSYIGISTSDCFLRKSEISTGHRYRDRDL